MAKLYSIATGNLTSDSTWGVINETSFLNSENATEQLLTTAYSGTRSAAFTNGSDITISHIGVKLCERMGTTGTMSVCIETDSNDTLVAGTEVTINTANLPAATEAALNGGWILFKLASPVTLTGGVAYQVAAKTSSATQVDLHKDGTAGNICRALVTTATKVPEAGDDFIIAKEHTGQGTGNARTVTMDDINATDYGSNLTAANSLIQPAIAICDGGTLSYGVAESTDYDLKVSGNIIVYSGGTFNIGTQASPIPRTSQAYLDFDYNTAAVDYGLIVRNYGYFFTYGLSRTAGKDVSWCKLTSDWGSGTTIYVNADTGWLANDSIMVGATTRTYSQFESHSLAADAGANSLTTSFGPAYSHTQQNEIKAVVGLISRNVIISGFSTTYPAFIRIEALGNASCYWTFFQNMGSSTTGKRGIETNITTAIVSFTHCCFNAFTSGSRGIVSAGTSGYGPVIDNCVFTNMGLYAIYDLGASVWVTNTVILGVTASTSYGINTVGTATRFTNVVISGVNGVGLTIGGTGQEYGYFDDIYINSCAGNGLAISTGYVGGIMEHLVIGRTGGYGIAFGAGSADGLRIKNGHIVGNASGGIQLNNFSKLVLDEFILGAEASYTQPIGIATNTVACGEVLIFNSSFGGGFTNIQAHGTADISVTNARWAGQIKMINTELLSTTEIANQGNISRGDGAFISSQKHDKQNGNHKRYLSIGTLSSDTTLYRTNTPSLRITNISANTTFSVNSQSFFVNVASGQTCTPTVYVRTSHTSAGDATNWNGYVLSLMVRRNDSLGITDDTYLDGAAATTGAWEALSGTTIAVTSDGVLEFFVQHMHSNSPTGWINVDDFSVVMG